MLTRHVIDAQKHLFVFLHDLLLQDNVPNIARKHSRNRGDDKRDYDIFQPTRHLYTEISTDMPAVMTPTGIGSDSRMMDPPFSRPRTL